MAEKVVLAGEGALWVQPGGPNTPLYFLGCHELGDIEVPKGDVKLLWCSTSDPNRYEVIDSLQGTAGGVTTSLTTDIRTTMDWMETVRCPVPLYVNVVTCGKKNVFDNWERSFVLQKSWITKETISKITSKDPETQDRAAQAYDMMAEKLMRIYGFAASRLSVAETEDINDIHFCNAETCVGNCGDAVDAGTQGYVGGGLLAGSPINAADVQYTDDAGVTWTFSSSKPFASAEVIASVRCFQKDKTTTRVIVARGTTDPSNPMEIAYSDNDGLTWTNVDVGSLNGQYALGPQALFVLDYFNIWLACSGGYIYKSEDGGATWTAQTSGGLTAQNLYAINFSGSKFGYAVGASNAILTTVDGLTWTTVAGPTAMAGVIIDTVEVLSRYRVWLGYAASGRLYFTHNGGTVWTERSHGGSGTGAVKYVDFLDEYFGVMAYNDAAGDGWIYATINGGTTWQTLVTPTTLPNAGFNSVFVVSPILIYVVGDAYAGTGMIMKIAGV